MTANLALKTDTTTMTKGERTDILSIIRQRDRVLKSATKHRAAELMADFEQKLAARFHFDQDDVWKKAMRQRKQRSKRRRPLSPKDVLS